MYLLNMAIVVDLNLLRHMACTAAVYGFVRDKNEVPSVVQVA